MTRRARQQGRQGNDGAGDTGQRLAGGLMKLLFQLVAEFVQRFQEVGDESRGQHHNMLVAVLGHLGDRLVGILSQMTAKRCVVDHWVHRSTRL